MIDMYTYISVEIRNEIHFVTSVVSESINRYNADVFPFKKEIGKNKYVVVNRSQVIVSQ